LFHPLDGVLFRCRNTHDDAPRHRHDRSHDVFDNYDSESALSQSADQRDGLRSTAKIDPD